MAEREIGGSSAPHPRCARPFFTLRCALRSVEPWWILIPPARPLAVFSVIKSEFVNRNSEIKMAEREGFEPPEPCGSAVFKTAAIDHSATSPLTTYEILIPSFPFNCQILTRNEFL